MTGLTKRQWAAIVAAAAVTMVAGCSGDANAPQTTSGTVGEAPTTAPAASESEAPATSGEETTAPGGAADEETTDQAANSIMINGEVLDVEYTAACGQYLLTHSVTLTPATTHQSVLLLAEFTDDLQGGIIAVAGLVNGAAETHTVESNEPESRWKLTATITDEGTGELFEIVATADCW